MKMYEESFIKISNVNYEKKNFYEFLLKNNLQIFWILMNLIQI